MKKGLKRSVIVGAIRGFALLAAIYTLTYHGVSNDIYGRGEALELNWSRLNSLALSSDCMLFLTQLAIIAPLGCLLGAVLGVVCDRIVEGTTQRPLRMLERVFFPILFVFVFCGVWAQLFLVQQPMSFSAQRWRSVMYVQRRAMIEDLTSHYKLKGMTVPEAETLLGMPNKDAEPWNRSSKYTDLHCLAYDLGHLTTKYGLCLALYYDKNETIKDWEVTRYKFW